MLEVLLELLGRGDWVDGYRVLLCEQLQGNNIWTCPWSESKLLPGRKKKKIFHAKQRQKQWQVWLRCGRDSVGRSWDESHSEERASSRNLGLDLQISQNIKGDFKCIYPQQFSSSLLLEEAAILWPEKSVPSSITPCPHCPIFSIPPHSLWLFIL